MEVKNVGSKKCRMMKPDDSPERRYAPVFDATSQLFPDHGEPGGFPLPEFDGAEFGGGVHSSIWAGSGAGGCDAERGVTFCSRPWAWDLTGACISANPDQHVSAWELVARTL